MRIGRRGRSMILAGALVGLAGAGTALAGGGYTATLSPDEEVPEPGQAGSSGTAVLKVDQAAGKACSTITLKGLDNPNAAHVHQGAKGVAGPVVINLGVPVSGQESCVDVTSEVAAAVAADPAGHYVNVHTAERPKGALRGQLSPKQY
ncbi:MAG: CHRD domain-containing protein [Acidimicrobiia bacterium]